MRSRGLAVTLLSVRIAAGNLSARAGSAMATDGQQMRASGLSATLTGSAGYPAVRGSVEYSTDHHDHDIDVRLRNAQLLAGKTLLIYLHGVKTGTVVVSRSGDAHLDRHGVPFCMAGQRVVVRTIPGVPVAAGTLRVQYEHY